MELEDFFIRLADPSRLKGDMPRDVIVQKYSILKQKYPDFVPLTESALERLAEVLKSKDGGSHWMDRTSVAILLRHEITKRQAHTCLSTASEARSINNLPLS